MRVIVAGSRHCDNYMIVARAIEASGFQITELVSGGCRGVDRLAERWAQIHGIPIERFKADFVKYGRPGGPLRNGEMAAYGDALVALPARRRSRSGTRDMIAKMRDLDKPVFVREV